MTNYLKLGRDAPLKGAIKALYLAMCTRANERGEFWAGRKKLAWDAGISEVTVKRCLKILLDEGYIKRVKTHGKTSDGNSTYTYTVVKLRGVTEVRNRAQGGSLRSSRGVTEDLYKTQSKTQKDKTQYPASRTENIKIERNMNKRTSISNTVEDIVNSYPVSKSYLEMKEDTLKYKEGNITPGSLGKFYLRVHNRVTEQSRVDIGRGEQKFITGLVEKLGDDAPDVILSALTEWSAYKSWMEQNTTAYNIPRLPSIKTIRMWPFESKQFADEFPYEQKANETTKESVVRRPDGTIY